LQVAPVEDQRIDFEDGYGTRADVEEDAHAEHTALECREVLGCADRPLRLGLRVKSFSRETKERAIRTLELFFARLTETGAPLGDFVVTLPKVRSAVECHELSAVLRSLASHHGIAEPIRCERMIETREALFDEEGRVAVPSLVRALGGRCIGVHLGSYDLTAELDVAAHVQSMNHPYCELGRLLLKMNAPRGVDVSDGATAQLPLAPHRGAELGEEARAENAHTVRGALRLHFDNVTSSLSRGIFQGWDLHPGQLLARYAAIYAFYTRARVAMTDRSSHFLAREARATNLGAAFDDMATGEALFGFFRRGHACGALDESDVRAAGLEPSELAHPTLRAALAARPSRSSVASIP
jgi:hypothetical protein